VRIVKLNTKAEYGFPLRRRGPNLGGQKREERTNEKRAGKTERPSGMTGGENWYVGRVTNEGEKNVCYQRIKKTRVGQFE